MASRPCAPSLAAGWKPSDHREFGKAFVEVKEANALFDGVWEQGERHQVWMSHGDRVTAIPEGFKAIATSDGAPFAAIADERRQFYATQFHMEVVHTPDGARLLRNFALEICGARGDWSMAHFKTEMVHKIRKQVGFDRVICGLSGGVDFAVTAVLIHEAIGEQLTCIFVDHGLMRLNEAEEVVKLFREAYNIPLVHVDASKHVPRCAGGRDRSREEAQDHRAAVRRGVRGGGKEGRRRWLPRAGHAVSGCDRERVLHGRAIGDDQVAPQCGRAA